MMATAAPRRASSGLVDYKEEESSGEESEEDYIVPQKRVRVDRNGKGDVFLIMPTLF